MRCWWKETHCLVSYREVLGRVRTFADKQKTNMASANKWHWSCASKYCKNHWKTPEISYHRLTKVQRASKEAIDRYVDVIGCKTKEKVKWTRAVLCSAHWSKQPAMVEVDLPDVKFTTGVRQVNATPSETKWHWNCAATLCNNSWRTEQNGASRLEYYKLSEVEKNKTLKNAYNKILKNKKVIPIKIAYLKLS